MSTLSPLAASLNVAIGGGLGALLRYHSGQLMVRWLGPEKTAAFPWATLCVNIVGSLLMGVLAGWLMRGSGESSQQLRLFVGVGLLGGFTTFSSFSLELMTLIERGQIGAAFAYGAVSVLAALGGLYFGLSLMRLA